MKILITEKQYNFIKQQEKKIDLAVANNLSVPGDIKSVSEWLNKNIYDIEFIYDKISINKLLSSIKEMEDSYEEFPNDLKRTMKIFKKLQNGEPAKPIFITYGDNSYFVMEGRHRMVAFKWFGLEEIPVIFVN